MIDKLQRLWHRSPDLRLGQLVCNLTPASVDPYFIEDDKMLDALRHEVPGRQQTRPVPVKALNDLAKGWAVFSEDESKGFHLLAEAVRAVLGRPETPEARALRTAKATRLDRLPIGNRTFHYRDE